MASSFLRLKKGKIFLFQSSDTAFLILNFKHLAFFTDIKSLIITDIAQFLIFITSKVLPMCPVSFVAHVPGPTQNPEVVQQMSRFF